MKRYCPDNRVKNKTEEGEGKILKHHDQSRVLKGPLKSAGEL